jgi:hypothetical protein
MDTSTNTTESCSNLITSLSRNIPTAARPARIVYDAALSSSLQVEDAAETAVSTKIREAVLRKVSQIDAGLHPLSISYLRAEVRPSLTRQAALDVSRLNAFPRLLFAYASAQEDLQNLDLELRPHLAVNRTGRKRANIDAAVDVIVDRASGENDTVREAVEVLGAWATRAWAQAVMSTVGPWAIASGLREMRLQGKMRPDLRQQLRVLAGGRVPGAPLH